MALDASPDDAVERYLKPHPLPPDVLYVIDQMMEDDLIDSGTYAVLNMYADRAEIDAVLDGHDFHKRREPHEILAEIKEREQQRAGGPPFVFTDAARELGRVCIARKRDTARNIIELADRTLATLPFEIQGAIAHESLRWLRKAIKSLATVEADWAYDDTTVGGAMLPYRNVVRLDGWCRPFKRDLRRLRSPSFIGRYVRHCDSSGNLKPIALALLNRAERVPAAFVVDSLQDHAAALEERRVAAREDAIRRFYKAVEADRPGAKVTRQSKVKIRFQRQVIKRALKTATGMVGDRAVSAFVRGQWVRLDGCRFDLMVRCRLSVARLGHGAVDVRAVASDHPSDTIEPRDLRIRVGSGLATPLADLCVFIEDTPALDQLTGFALLMAAGREDELLKTANVIKSYPEGDAHPVFAERARSRLLDITANIDNWTVIENARRVSRSGRRWYDRTKHREMLEAYVKETESIWIERLTVSVCGRRGKLLALAA